MTKYDKKQWHPLSFGGGVLFQDNHIECCWMSTALEYSASIECGTKLIHKMEVERLRGNMPLVLMIVDDYGVLHPPNGLERTTLSEEGFGELQVIMHYHTDSNPKHFYQHNDDFGVSSKKFALFIKKIKDIVPAPPIGMYPEFGDGTAPKSKL